MAGRGVNGGCAKARGGGVRWMCGGLVHENRGGMFRETVLTACGTGRFAVTIKEQRKARSAQASSGGDGMSCEAWAVFPNVTQIMPQTLRVSCGVVRRHVRRGRVASPHLRC